MRTMQQILNAVMEAGHYTPARTEDSPDVRHSCFMCHALNYAASAGTIEYHEADKAAVRIHKYMDTSPTYRSALVSLLAKLPCNAAWLGVIGTDQMDERDKALCLPVYKNWAKRPSLKTIPNEF